LLVVAAYRFTRAHDPGLTTEVALLTTFLLGAMCVHAPALASGLGVVVALLLAARKRLHRWVRDVLTDQEVHDGLILAAAVLVILPLTPATAVDPWGALVPRKLWAIAVLLMAVNTAGYIALRVLGARAGLPLAGFISGFISSAATIGAMGSRGVTQPALLRGCVAGAALSSVATVVQLAAILTVAGPETLARAAWPLAAAGAVAGAYGALFTIRIARDKTPSVDLPSGGPFDVRTALWFAGVLGAAALGSAVLTSRFGGVGLVAAAAVTGLADAHAAAASAASLAAGGAAHVDMAALGVMAALTANTLTKCVVAGMMGGVRFAAEVVPGLLLMIVAAWAGAAGVGLIG
jgi:uncharacterized membrane protein (DUF4010 family)